jgi:hypothetical protein
MAQDGALPLAIFKISIVLQAYEAPFPDYAEIK